MKPMRLYRPVQVVAVLAAGLLLASGCAEWNDNAAPTFTMKVSFSGGDSLTNGVIVSPHETDPNTAEVKSIIVGAIVISRATAWSTSEAETLTDEEKDELTDDAVNSADYLTIEDLPYNGDSISFLIPPASAGNWQLIAVASRDNIDVLADFDGNDDAAIWYGFSDGDFLNGLVVPGSQIAVQMAPACSLDDPPDTPGDGLGACQ